MQYIVIANNRQLFKFWFLNGIMEGKTKISAFVTISCVSHID